MVNLFMLIGLPGSGKSTWASNMCSTSNAVWLSSDRIREELFNDVNEQRYNDKVFNTLTNRIIENLEWGRDVIYDATNTHRRRRMDFLNKIPESINVNKVAVLFAIPFENCCRRNNLRSRSVPESVIWKFYKGFQIPHISEGFDSIEVVYDETYNKSFRRNFLKSYNDSLILLQDNPHHNTTVGLHCELTYSYGKGFVTRENLNTVDSTIFLEACRWHDIGKLKTKIFTDDSGIAHFYGHENVSAYDYLCANIHNPTPNDVVTSTDMTNIILYTALLINLHMIPYTNDCTVSKYKELFGGFYDLVELLHECDRLSH